jgi:hypothetical protein
MRGRSLLAPLGSRSVTVLMTRWTTFVHRSSVRPSPHRRSLRAAVAEGIVGGRLEVIRAFRTLVDAQAKEKVLHGGLSEHRWTVENDAGAPSKRNVLKQGGRFQSMADTTWATNLHTYYSARPYWDDSLRSSQDRRTSAGSDARDPDAY